MQRDIFNIECSVSGLLKYCAETGALNIKWHVCYVDIIISLDLKSPVHKDLSLSHIS